MGSRTGELNQYNQKRLSTHGLQQFAGVVIILLVVRLVRRALLSPD